MKKILLTILFLLFCVSSYGADLSVDIEEDGGGDYTTLAAALQAEEQNLTDNGGDTITFNINLGWDAADATAAIIDEGWTLSETCWLKIITTGDSRPTNGVWDTTDAYRLIVNNAFALNTSGAFTPWIKLDGLQIDCTGTWNRNTITSRAFYDAVMEIDDCILKKTNTGTGYIIQSFDCDPDIKVTNTIFEGRGADIGMYTNTYSVITLKHCTISNLATGVYSSHASATITVENCAVFNNGDDFAITNSTPTIDYCASDDGDGNNPVDISPGGTEADDWDSAFTDYSNGDFSVKDASSVLYNAGKDASITVDIIETVRPQATDYDIGAFELIAAAPAARRFFVVD